MLCSISNKIKFIISVKNYSISSHIIIEAATRLLIILFIFSMALSAFREAQSKLHSFTKHGFSGPNAYTTTKKKIEAGIWPWPNGFRSRLPEFYKESYMSCSLKKPRAIHYVPENDRKYTIDNRGIRIPYSDVPIPLVFPPEANSGLWGGEGIVEGLKHKKNIISKEWSARIWKPFIFKRIFYSEILDEWLAINVTTTTLERIDEIFGFDNYILGTHEIDLKSKLGMKLKREMMLVLVDNYMDSNNTKQRVHVYNKYKHFLIPKEEIEWLGLDIHEAEKKQQMLEHVQLLNVAPMKYKLHHSFVKRLQTKLDGKGEGFLHKINPWN